MMPRCSASYSFYQSILERGVLLQVRYSEIEATICGLNVAAEMLCHVHVVVNAAEECAMSGFQVTRRARFRATTRTIRCSCGICKQLSHALSFRSCSMHTVGCQTGSKFSAPGSPYKHAISTARHCITFIYRVVSLLDFRYLCSLAFYRGLCVTCSAVASRTADGLRGTLLFRLLLLQEMILFQHSQELHVWLMSSS